MRNALRVAVACCAGIALAHGAETRELRGKRIVDEALQALGGEAFLNVKDRVETGRAYSFDNREELSGLSVARMYTRYLTAADPPVAGALEERERESFGKKEEISAALFTEQGAWEITFRGARPLSDERYERFKDSTLRNFFYILRKRLTEPGLTFYWQSSDLYENRPVEIVDITDAGNATVTVYFSRNDKLPVRQVFKRRNPEFKDFDTEVTVFSKYRDVGGGVKWPFSVRRERNGQKLFEMYSDSVEINKGLTDDLFELPPGIKTLPKEKK